MFKYLVATGAALYCVLLVFGDENRRAEVTRQAQDDVTGYSLASFSLPDARVSRRTAGSGISEAEAVALAMDAGRVLRADRKAAPMRGLIEAVAAKSDATATEAAGSASASTLQYVSGTNVNLRAGPGTGNPVVGRLAYGDAAEVMSDRDGWFEIRSADGNVSGWIYGKFLSPQKPS